MDTIDRRSFLRTSLIGAAVATVGLALIPEASEALPLAIDRIPTGKPEGLVDGAQTVGWDSHHRHRRRWTCWWRRGHRICGWRRW